MSFEAMQENKQSKQAKTLTDTRQTNKQGVTKDTEIGKGGEY